ncbi:MAG: hypothetical protein Q9174_005954 [Haloplaca sp. 1 TL-2023]
MLPNTIQWLALSFCLVLRILAAPAATNVSLAPRYDYEPGDTFTRTMCYCTTDDYGVLDPEHVFRDKPGKFMAYRYQFDYFNHRLEKTMSLYGEYECQGMGPLIPKGSSTYSDETDDHLCLSWEKLTKTYCHSFRWDTFPARGIDGNHDYEFCYHHDSKKGGGTDKDKDWFRFDGDKRGLPHHRDFSAPPEEVDKTCEKMCKVDGFGVYRNEGGVWRNGIDMFHHFDDICTAPMECSLGGGHHGR